MRKPADAATLVALIVSGGFMLLAQPPALALEKKKVTQAVPANATVQSDGLELDQKGKPLEHDQSADVTPEGPYWYLLEDQGYFLPPIADVNFPGSYMRFYPHGPVDYSTGEGNGTRTFWDVGFGEEFFIVGRNNRTRLHDPAPGNKRWHYGPPDTTERWRTGWALFVDGDMHMLLDFHGDSSPVIDSEFRIGGGLMGRGLPWVTEPRSLMSHFAWRLKLFHESTHVGDEYLDDIRRRQFNPLPGDPPLPPGFIHPNVSYMALELLLAIDGTFSRPRQVLDADASERPPLYWRLYGGMRRLPWGSPYDMPLPGAMGDPYPGLDLGRSITVPGGRTEGQFGGEARLRLTKIAKVGARWPDYIVLGSDTYVRKQFDYDGSLASPRWLSVNTMAGVEWGDWADDQMTFRALFSYYRGINPHGQFRAELLEYGGFTLQIDY